MGKPARLISLYERWEGGEFVEITNLGGDETRGAGLVRALVRNVEREQPDAPVSASVLTLEVVSSESEDYAIGRTFDLHLDPARPSRLLGRVYSSTEAQEDGETAEHIEKHRYAQAIGRYIVGFLTTTPNKSARMLDILRAVEAAGLVTARDPDARKIVASSMMLFADVAAKTTAYRGYRLIRPADEAIRLVDKLARGTALVEVDKPGVETVVVDQTLLIRGVLSIVESGIFGKNVRWVNRWPS